MMGQDRTEFNSLLRIRGGVGMALTSGLVIGLLLAVCFCTRPMVLLWLAFGFNALFLGHRLFGSLAQEREKQTIDALRLTQLSSLGILRLKADRDLRDWCLGNAFLLGVGVLVAWQSGGGGLALLLNVLGLLAMAAGGLFAISQALLVSTFFDRTSQAVLGGWLTKLVWLLAPPLVDQTLQAMTLSDTSPTLARLLDPAWLAFHQSQAFLSPFTVHPMTALLAGIVLLLGAAAVSLGWAVYQIDGSFERQSRTWSSGRHAVYEKSFPFGLDSNAFFVRELAAQVRAGAGGWPGYAVFLVLFFGPFLYGSSQASRTQLGIVAPHGWGVATPQEMRDAEKIFAQSAHLVGGSTASVHPEEEIGLSERIFGSFDDVRHSHSACVVHFTRGRKELRLRTIVDRLDRAAATPKAALRSDSPFTGLTEQKESFAKSWETQNFHRGLLASLLLSFLYLFLRGVAFSAGTVAGEKERRSWDQMVLTGASPGSFLLGKFAAVAYYPVRQLLLVSPVLLVFVGVGALSALELVAVVGLLLAIFLASVALGFVCSAAWGSTHFAQGMALILGLGFALLPMVPVLGYAVIVVLAFALSTAARYRALTFTCLLGLSVQTGSSFVSPVFPLSVGNFLPEQLLRGVQGVDPGFALATNSFAIYLLCSSAWVALAGWICYQVAQTRLEQGGGLRAS